MRADRLLSEILLLQSHGRLSGRSIAKKLEVCERTIHRDMESLSAAGVPVFAVRGAHGGWQLDDGWRTQVPGLDEAEIRALLMSQPRILGDARLAGAAERALGKLVAAMPDALRAKAVNIRQRLHVDTAAWRGSSENLTWLPLVQEAVAHDRKLLIYYRKPGEAGRVAPRRVDPLGLVAKGSTWYLVANTVRGLRTFRVSRIEGDIKFEKYGLLVQAEFIRGWDVLNIGNMPTKIMTFEAVLRLEPRAAAWMQTWHLSTKEEVGSTKDEEKATSLTKVIPTEAGSRSAGIGRAEGSAFPDDWVTLRVRFDHEKEALFMVLGLGSHAEILEPATLREQLAAEVAAMTSRHRARSASAT